MDVAVKTHKRVTGLSGNEIYCLNQLGLTAGQLCIGNSVVSIGMFGGISAGLSTLVGGEVTEITQLVHDSRMNSFDRMKEEAGQYGGVGLTGISFDLVNHGGNLEFITVGSTIHGPGERPNSMFSTSADAQELYCQMDAGFEPLHFVFGNVAYSIGVGGNLLGGLKTLVRGEVPQYTNIFSRTRSLALHRIKSEAKIHGANAVIGIRTTISALMGAQEMLMVGTASRNPALSAYNNDPVTSDMTNEEMWNLTHLGFVPLQLVMGVSVYSLGFAGGFVSALQSLGRGEIPGLTNILYEAREKALARIEEDAERCGADEVVGVKTWVYDLGGGMVEFLAIGTAVKKMPGIKTRTESLPPQAIIVDEDTFVDSTNNLNLNLGRKVSAAEGQAGPIGIVITVLIILFYLFVASFRISH